MISVSVFYEDGQGRTFDLGDCLGRHMARVKEKLAAACTRQVSESKK